MAGTARYRGIPAELPVAALVAAAALPLTRLFKSGLGGTVLLVIATATFVSWGVRRLHVPAALGWLISIVALAWFLSVRFFPSTLAVIFPSGQTLSAIATAIKDGAQRIYTDAPPVDASPAILLYVAAGIWLTTWLVDASAITLENPLLSIASALPLFLVAGSLKSSGHLWVDAGVFVLAAAAVLYSHERARSRRLAGGVLRAGWHAPRASILAVVGAILAVTLAPALPGFGGPPALRGKGGGQVTFNPFIAIRPTLQNATERLLFIARVDVPIYHRLATVEHFDGVRFSHRAFGDLTDTFGQERPPGDVLAVRSSYRIGALGGPWIPAPFQAIGFVGPDGTRIELGSGGIFPPSGAASGMTYQVQSVAPAPTRTELDVPVSYDARALAPYLQLPRRDVATLRSIATQLVGDATTPFLKAARIQNYLRRFQYDEKVAAHHSYGDIVTFLTKVQRGYCEQFAASMAVLLRTLGIPTRVAIGFAPGRVDPQGSPNVYRVTTRYAHSWVEVYFPQAGWVPFEPTPRAGFVGPPDYTVARSGSGPSADPPELPAPDRSASPQPSTLPSEAAPETPSTRARRGIAIPWRWLVLAMLVLAFPALVVGAAWIRRRARLASATTSRSKAVIRYVDLLRWFAAAGYPRAPGETPRELSARLGAVVPAAAESLGTLATLVESALWAPANGLEDDAIARAADASRRAIAATLNRRTRLRAMSGVGAPPGAS